MRFLIPLAALCILAAAAGTAPAQDLRFDVSNRCPAAPVVFVVVNKCPVPSRQTCRCGTACPCPAGSCPTNCPAAQPATLLIGGIPHELRADGVYWPVTAARSAPTGYYSLPTYGAQSCPGGRCPLPR